MASCVSWRLLLRMNAAFSEPTNCRISDGGTARREVEALNRLRQDHCIAIKGTREQELAHPTHIYRRRKQKRRRSKAVTALCSRNLGIPTSNWRYRKYTRVHARTAYR
ncbi:hypothetical protein BD626DRAFT_497026 [Schizophyllum amplum]|uniref:Uncharacterized protein n=1 Tax=Schizophyllum amplum TaxID=97359 RepID=A0A550CDR2_9AGAR|nr:hypothetical protein BD626DRAFT_497026 [Auriculariopsis ampla]